MNTCTGEAAVSIPATPPPKTRPSDPASDTLKPPDLLRLPLLSESKKEPDREMISNRPWKENGVKEQKSQHYHMRETLNPEK
jgi:hypothetical protein